MPYWKNRLRFGFHLITLFLSCTVDGIGQATQTHLFLTFQDTVVSNLDFLKSNRLNPYQIYFYNTTIKGTNSFQTRADFGLLSIWDSRVDSAKIFSFDSVFLVKDSIKYLLIKGTDLLRREKYSTERKYAKKIALFESTVNTGYFSHVNLVDFDATKVNFKKKLSFHHSSLIGKFTLEGIELPDTLEFVWTDILKLDGDLNLTQYNRQKSRTKVCNLVLWGVDISKIKIYYDDFKLVFPESGNFLYEDKVFIYQQLLSNFKQKGIIDSFEKLDKEFSELKYTGRGNSLGYILNWIDRHWWDYGYNKFLVVRNAIFLNFIFFLMNIFIYKKLLYDGYRMEKFVVTNEMLERKYLDNSFNKLIFELPYIFLYTSYIFWGLRLDVERINVQRIGIFIYVLIQYLVGVVCLAYMANLIITV